MSGSGCQRTLWDGQSTSALPPGSDVNLFRDSERVFDLDTKISNSALHFRMSQEQLHRPEITGTQRTDFDFIDCLVGVRKQGRAEVAAIERPRPPA